MAGKSTYRVGVDIGGTFTDIVLLGSDGTIHTQKISSSVDNYARALVLEDGVGRDRRAVADLLDGGAAKPGFAKDLSQAVDDGLGVVLDARGNLLGVDGAV